jgi:hypothetical protein
MFDIGSAVSVPALESLSRRYAAAVDHRDRQALLGVFNADAVMQIERPGRDAVVLTGFGELGAIIDMVAGWPRTMHLTSQGLYQLDGECAVGEVYCTAHHFTALSDGKGHDLVMYIRYQDRYQIDSDYQWRIIARTVVIDATEDRLIHIDSPA